ncbi:MAG: DUF349 domain-containing protein [Erysipelotrichaceae bacterium]|nr:DUF349 domain-containing protein [Erysipelotrichaceae bacterium]
MEDKNIDFKQKLLEQVKELSESENVADLWRQANALKKKWRTNEEEESFFEKEMKEEFDACLDKIYAKAGVVSKSAEEAKAEIIAKAQELLNETNFKKASDKMNELMNDWKASGRTASKEKDDELWESFKGLRDQFYEKKNEYFAKLKENFAQSKATKEELIEKATQANETTDIKELTKAMTSLMDEWKKAGSAGKKDDDDLWDKFLAQRKVFYAKRKEYYDSMKEVFASRAAQKKDIITEARRLLACSEFTPEEVDAVKTLRNKWKEVGNAGKENDDKLWEEFNTIVNKYFTNKRESM